MHASVYRRNYTCTTFISLPMLLQVSSVSIDTVGAVTARLRSQGITRNRDDAAAPDNTYENTVSQTT
jgi:hypothetical protein